VDERGGERGVVAGTDGGGVGAFGGVPWMGVGGVGLLGGIKKNKIK
jgi:hypothetical protein